MNECGHKLEPMKCDVICSRKNSQGTLTEEKIPTTKGASKHDAFMLFRIRTTLTDSQVFQVISSIVGFVVLCIEILIH